MGVKVEEIKYTSGDEPVHAFLYLPGDQAAGGESASEGWPAVVLAPGRDREVQALDWLARPLAEAGFLILGTTYRDGEVRVHETDIEDVMAAVSYLIGLTTVDAARVGLIGHSRGGAAVLGAAARDPRIRAVVALAPVTDHARYVGAMRHYSPSRYAAMVKMRGGAPEEIPEYYKTLSAVEEAWRIKAPVLLVHGTLDLLVPMEQSRWMQEALQRGGNHNVRLELISQAGHFFERKFIGYVFDQVNAICLDWLNEVFAAGQRPLTVRQDASSGG